MNNKDKDLFELVEILEEMTKPRGWLGGISWDQVNELKRWYECDPETWNFTIEASHPADTYLFALYNLKGE